MDYREIWNDICYRINKNNDVSERDFQNIFEILFEKLGWSQRKGEIVPQKKIPIGSANALKPDIIIKNNEEFIFVVELKKPNAGFSERNANQLISYMRQIKIDFGILLGETLQLFYELPNDKKLPIKISDIKFIENSDEGTELIKLLSKEEYSFEKLQKYCDEKLAKKAEYEKIKEYVNLLCSEKGTNFILNLLRKELILIEDLSEESISLIFDKINIFISKKEKFVPEISTSKFITKKSTVNSENDQKRTVNGMKIGKFVQDSIRKAYVEGLISQEEINNLQNKDYSKMIFNQSLEILRHKNKNTQDNSGRSRYYQPELFCGEYYLNAQWNVSHWNNFLIWLNKLGYKLNS